MTRRSVPSALVLLVLPFSAWLCTTAPPAFGGDESGGTRSVFAAGAGNRALALGGAFVAMADDASAVVWNPGALAGVTRMEVQATHAAFGDLGFRQDYAAFALPSWRWGVAAFSVQRFGSDGIEERDDRNYLVRSDLTDSETEFTVGYGRAVGPGVSLGGAVKLQRQSLAGRSGSALGADLGVLVRPGVVAGSRGSWTDGLTWGLSVRNIVEPSIRLDEESVSDPGVLRTGLAFESAAFGGRFVTAALDLERTHEMSPRLRGGLEVRLVPSLSLRAGTNGGRLTAGTGLSWRGFAMDYVFEEGALGAVHRFGLSRSIGPTTEERRDAALQKQERAVLARLEEAFRLREREQIEGLLAQARAADARHDHEATVGLLSTISTLAPGHPEAAALERSHWMREANRLEREGEYLRASLAYGRVLASAPDDSAALTGANRARSAGDQRAARSAELRARFADALEALARDDLREARAGFAAVVAAEPGDKDAGAMLAYVENVVSRRTQSLLRQARRSVESRVVDQAADLLEQARALDPGAPGLAEVSVSLARMRAAPATGPGVDPMRLDPVGSESPAAAGGRSRRPAPARVDTREVEALYKRGLQAIAQKRPDDALRYWELVWSMSPGYMQVDGYLKREYLTRGMEHFAEGRLEEAMGYWERALRVDPKDPQARGYLARAQTQLSRTRELMGEIR